MDQQIGDDHPRKSEDRSHRQVDVAADDDEHHAGGHDAHDAGLDRQVVHIPGGEEDAVGHDIERDPNDQQGHDHGQHAVIDVGLSEASGKAVAVCFGRVCRVGHWELPGESKSWGLSGFLRQGPQSKNGRSAIYTERPLEIEIIGTRRAPWRRQRPGKPPAS